MLKLIDVNVDVVEMVFPLLILLLLLLLLLLAAI